MSDNLNGNILYCFLSNIWMPAHTVEKAYDRIYFTIRKLSFKNCLDWIFDYLSLYITFASLADEYKFEESLNFLY